MCVFALAPAAAGVMANVAANIGVISAIGSAGMGAYGAYQSSQANKQAAAYQAQIARNNATIAEWKAKDTEERGRTAEIDYRVKVEGFKGDQRAKLAAQGFDINEDDPLDILADTAGLGERDALTIRSNTEREAWKNRLDAQNATAQGVMFQAKSDAESPFLAGATNLLGGVSSVASKWYAFSKRT